MNARIWTFLNDGFVKLTLEAGRPLVWSKFGRHDEGWSSEVHRWEWDGNELVESICTDGRDCDGRLSTHALFRTTPDRFHARSQEVYYECGGIGEAICTPEWEKVEAGQRDYSAEAMNY